MQPLSQLKFSEKIIQQLNGTHDQEQLRYIEDYKKQLEDWKKSNSSVFILTRPKLTALRFFQKYLDRDHPNYTKTLQDNGDLVV
jgi:hypothetical protein